MAIAIKIFQLGRDHQLGIAVDFSPWRAGIGAKRNVRVSVVRCESYAAWSLSLCVDGTSNVGNVGARG